MQVKLSGVQPILTVQDLHTMFAMFDLTNRGTITSEQANAAVRSVLGADAKLGAIEGVESGASLTRDQFTTAMQAAMQKTVPYQG